MSEKIEFEASISSRIVYKIGSGEITLLFDQETQERIGWPCADRYRVTLEPVEPELKPCPFCGGEALFDVSNPARWGWGNDYHVVKCSDCGARIRPSSVKEQTTAVWNRRASNE